MASLEWIGAAAAILTTSSFLPQVVRTWRSGSADDFSALWLAMFSAGLALWLGYGFAIGSWSLMAANGVTLGLVISIAAIKWRGLRRS